MINKLIITFDNLSIRYKLFIMFFLLTSIPFLIFIVTNFYFSSNDNKNQAMDSSKRMLLQSKSVIEYKISNIKNVVAIFYLNDTIRELLNTDTDFYSNNFGNWLHDRDRFSNLIYSIQSNRDISRLQLYMDKGLGIYSETNELLNLQKVRQTEWYKQLISGKTTYQWFPSKYFSNNSNDEYISVLRVIPSNQNLKIPVGIIKTDILETNIRTILDQTVFSKDTSVLLINSKNEILSSTDNSKSIMAALTVDITSKFGFNKSPNNRWETIVLNNEKFLFGAVNIENTDWNLLAFIPYKDILALNKKTMNRMILILCTLLPLTLPLSLVVAASSTKRIRNLISHMKKVENGNFDVNILPSNNDEIGILTQNYNSLITKISMLVDDKFNLGKEMKNIELKALQAQINPHFLYNTLDLIYWISIDKNVSEIGGIISQLSKFYRLSLSKGADIVSIKNELEHVSAYVEIQNARFENRIQFHVDINEELYQYKILKITLQPLVENAILHGIFKKQNGCGTVAISVVLQDNIIKLYVKDDGIGIPEDLLPELLIHTSTKDSHGYGIRNINERIILNYGPEYGLTYKSRLDFGTSVEIKIPAIK